MKDVRDLRSMSPALMRRGGGAAVRCCAVVPRRARDGVVAAGERRKPCAAEARTEATSTLKVSVLARIVEDECRLRNAGNVERRQENLKGAVGVRWQHLFAAVNRDRS